MTVTESKPDDVASLEGRDPVQPAPPAPPGGLIGVLATSDHKTVGRLYLGCSLPLLIAGLVLSALVAAEGMDGSSLDILTNSTFFQVETLSHVALVFMGVLPAFLGLGLFLVPLQVGSPTIAFPRAAAASFWGWLLGSGVLLAAYLADGGPVGGRSDAVLLFFSAWVMVIGSLAVGCICIIATVATARTAGMTLARVPAFSWAMLVACSLWLLNLASLAANLLIVSIDTRHATVLYGAPANRWAQLSWIFAQPAVLSFAIPLLGVVGDAVPIAARTRQGNHPVVLGAIAAFGALGFGAYAQTAFNPDLVHQALFVMVSVVVVLPLLVLFGGWADTLRRGRVRPTSAFLLGEAGLLLLLGSAVCAALYAIEPLDLAYTQWGIGVEKGVVAASVCGIGAGLFHWGSKIWGHRVVDPAGKLAFLVLLAGGVLYAGGDLIAGANGQIPAPPNGIAPVVVDGAELGAIVSAVGAVVLAVGVLLIMAAVLPAMARRGPRADADPWNGHTLEWTTTSPPPLGNFLGPVMEVSSPSPLLDAREAATTKEVS